MGHVAERDGDDDGVRVALGGASDVVVAHRLRRLRMGPLSRLDGQLDLREVEAPGARAVDAPGADLLRQADRVVQRQARESIPRRSRSVSRARAARKTAWEGVADSA
jgi:hypothetical protein